MSDVVKDLQINRIMLDVAAVDKKQALMMVAQEAARDLRCSPTKIYERLSGKEQQASSGVGGGIAIPHMRMLQAPRPYAIMFKLKTPIMFDAIDNKPVDIICTLISPRQESPIHLRRLSRISRTLADEDICAKIRELSDADTIKSLMMSPNGWTLVA